MEKIHWLLDKAFSTTHLEGALLLRQKKNPFLIFSSKKRTTRNENRRKRRITTVIEIISLNERDFLGFMTLTGHGGNCSCGTPPQSLVFSFIDIALASLKTPSDGPSPLMSLNEKFNFFRNGSFSKPFGVDLNRLFLETSRN